MKKTITYITGLLLIAAVACGTKFNEREPITVNDPLKKHQTATISTSMGDITIKLHWEAAPYTCLNFAKLASKGYYNNVVFHRVISNFMIQTGDPQGTGMGGAGFERKKFNDEINADAIGLNKKLVKSNIGLYRREIRNLFAQKSDLNSREKRIEYFQKIVKWSVKKLLQHVGYRYTKRLPSRKAVRGSLAMANSGPDSNGSQFFINIINTPWLDGKHTVFASVTKGVEIADKISLVDVDRMRKPLKEIKIIKITLN